LSGAQLQARLVGIIAIRRHRFSAFLRPTSVVAKTIFNSSRDSYILQPANSGEFLPAEFDGDRSRSQDLGPSAAAAPATTDERSRNRSLCGLEGGPQESPGIFLRITVLEDSASGNENLSTSAHRVRHRVLVDSAIDFNAKVQLARLSEP
jgi:hypothetical protein